MRLGLHVSISGKLTQAFIEGTKSGCEALQIFSGSPRMWKTSPISLAQAQDFKKQRGDFAPLVVHASYLINLGSLDLEVRRKSKEALLSEVERCQLLGADYLVLHPGGGAKEAVTLIGEGLSQVLDSAEGIKILLENVAGEGNKLGKNFSELFAIIKATRGGDKLGICFDTCHAFGAGYDLRKKDTWDKLKQEIDDTVGLDRINLLHLNDSKADLGHRLDRHANWGQGYLGQVTINNLAADGFFRTLPGILETPGDLEQRSLDLKLCREWLSLEG